MICGQPSRYRINSTDGKRTPVDPCKAEATIPVGWTWRCPKHAHPDPPDPNCTHSLANPHPQTGRLTCSYCCGIID